MANNILDKIIKAKAARLADLKAAVSLEDIEAKARGLPAPALDFLAALTAPKASATGGPGIHVIAEVKKASPSRGVIREDFQPLEIAKGYLAGGASALSVLTEEDHFQGHDRYLRDISRAVALPTLRKDFIIDPYQIFEAKVLGASAFLLIVACLKPKQLAAMIALGAELKLTALVEAHTEAETKAAVDAGAPLIGINNRDLKTFHTSLETTYKHAGDRRVGHLQERGSQGLGRCRHPGRPDRGKPDQAERRHRRAPGNPLLLTAKILFVCLGNICRSPIAEGVFAHLVRERGLEGRFLADSAGTGNWHRGEPPDPRAIAVAGKRGVNLPSLCRQVNAEDFQSFDFILAMDRNNQKDLNALCPASLKGKIRLMRDFDAESQSAADVPDPYYGGPYEFDTVYQMLHRCCSSLLEQLESGSLVAGNAQA
jgi:indole-3-glycerol phosphate synthase